MRRALLVIALAAPFLAHAAEEANLREARALVDAMHVESQLQAMTGAMSQAMSRQMGGAGGDPRVAQVFMSESMAVMRERALRPGGMVDQMIEAYAETFAVDELRDIRAFYESAAGRKMLEKAPQLMGRVMERSIGAGREAMPEICERARARLQSEGLDNAARAMRCPSPPPAKGND